MTLEEMMKVAEALGLGPDATYEDFMAKIGAMKSDDGGGDKPEPPPKDEPAPAEMAAAARQLLTSTGKPTYAEALAELSRCRKITADVEEREAKLAADRAALEAGERDGLVVELVRRGEPPATAWADALLATDRSKRKPAEPWASMPIEQLRARVATLGGAKSPPPRPPVSGGADPHGLSESELAICAETKCPPETFARLKAQRANGLRRV